MLTQIIGRNIAREVRERMASEFVRMRDDLMMAEAYMALGHGIDPEDYFPGILGEPVKPGRKAKEMRDKVFDVLKKDLYFQMAIENCPDLSEIEGKVAGVIQKGLEGEEI
jgi:hypothetical protein